MMDECEYGTECSEFFEGKLKGTVSIYRQNYCNSNFSKCARYLVRKSKGRGKVPESLFPHESERANDLTSG